MAASKLSADLVQELALVEPSIKDGVSFYPCSVTLKDGRTVDRVYLMEASDFKCPTHWERPEDMPGAPLCISADELSR